MIPAFHPIQSQHLLINLMLSKDNILPKLELGGFYYVSTKEKNYREEPIFIYSVCSNKRIQENYSLTPFQQRTYRTILSRSHAICFLTENYST